MPGIQSLREERAGVGDKMKALMDGTEGKTWEVVHQEQFNAFESEVNAIDQRIANVQKHLDVEAKVANEVRRIADSHNVSDDLANEVRTLEKGVVAAWIRNGRAGLDEESRRVQSNRFSEIRNIMSTGVGSEGAYTVEEQMARSISDGLAAYGGMREVADVLRTASGSQLNYPTSDGRSEEGEIVGENQSATAADPNYGTVPIDAYKLGSKIVAVPFELIQDSSFDIEAHVRGRLEQRLGRISNRLSTTGLGVSQHNGIVTAAAAGKVGPTGQATSVNFDDLTDLEHSVDPAYRQSSKCGYMFHDTTLRELKKLKDTTGRPLWLAGHDVGSPDMINGQRYTINQDMPVMAANARSILYGDYSHYKIRDVMSMLLFRFADSKYAERGQVGFLAWMRGGGNLVDVGGAVRYYQNSAT